MSEESSNTELDKYFDVALKLVKQAGQIVNIATKSRNKKGNTTK